MKAPRGVYKGTMEQRMTQWWQAHPGIEATPDRIAHDIGSTTRSVVQTISVMRKTGALPLQYVRVYRMRKSDD
jgi:hypothetical protein